MVVFMTKNKYVAFRTTEEIYSIMEKAAEKNNISVGKLINISVLDYLKETKLRDIELYRKII